MWFMLLTMSHFFWVWHQLFRISMCLLILCNQRFFTTSCVRLWISCLTWQLCLCNKQTGGLSCDTTDSSGMRRFDVDRKEEACVSGCFDHQQVPYLLPAHQGSSSVLHYVSCCSCRDPERASSCWSCVSCVLSFPLYHVPNLSYLRKYWFSCVS